MIFQGKFQWGAGASKNGGEAAIFCESVEINLYDPYTIVLELTDLIEFFYLVLRTNQILILVESPKVDSLKDSRCKFRNAIQYH